jgi:mRNA interferase MazF
VGYKEELVDWADDKYNLHLKAQKKSVQQIQCKYGEIYWAYLGKNVGSEQNEKRPVLIIQNDIGNRFGPTTIVAPITDPDEERPKPLPTEVLIHLESDKPDPDDPTKKLVIVTGVIRCQQIRVLSKARLENRICDLNDEELEKLNPQIDQIKKRVKKACKISLNL